MFYTDDLLPKWCYVFWLTRILNLSLHMSAAELRCYSFIATGFSFSDQEKLFLLFTIVHFLRFPIYNPGYIFIYSCIRQDTQALRYYVFVCGELDIYARGLC